MRIYKLKCFSRLLSLLFSVFKEMLLTVFYTVFLVEESGGHEKLFIHSMHMKGFYYLSTTVRSLQFFLCTFLVLASIIGEKWLTFRIMFGMPVV